MFGVFPLRCQFADEKAPNKLGIPTGESFFNRVIETKGTSPLASVVEVTGYQMSVGQLLQYRFLFSAEVILPRWTTGSKTTDALFAT